MSLNIFLEKYFSSITHIFSKNIVTQKELIKNILLIYNINIDNLDNKPHLSPKKQNLLAEFDKLNVDEQQAVLKEMKIRRYIDDNANSFLIEIEEVHKVITVIKEWINEDEMEELIDFFKKIPNELKTIFESPIKFLITRNYVIEGDNIYSLDNDFINMWNNLSDEEKGLSLQENTLDMMDNYLYDNLNSEIIFDNHPPPLYLLEILSNNEKIDLFFLREQLEEILTEISKEYHLLENVKEFRCEINSELSSPAFYQEINDQSFPLPNFQQIPLDILTKWKCMIKENHIKWKKDIYLNALNWIIDNMDEKKIHYFMDRRYG